MVRYVDDFHTGGSSESLSFVLQYKNKSNELSHRTYMTFLLSVRMLFRSLGRGRDGTRGH